MATAHCNDGNVAAAMASFKFIDASFVYPITPSTTMAENVEKWAAMGQKNLFGFVPVIDTPQAELGAIAAMHGSLSAGSLTSTYTSAQGLLLMIPNLYHIAGENLPGVVHVACRSIGTHSSTLSPDHTDVLACRQTGISILSSGCVQEAYDMSAIAHLVSISAQRGFIHFFEGFRVSHQLEDFYTVDDETLKSMVNFEALYKWRRHEPLDTENATGRNPGTSNSLLWHVTEAQNVRQDLVVTETVRIMEQWAEKTGRRYAPFVYIGHPEAEQVIVQMGCSTHTTEIVIRALVAKGYKVGMIRVHLYRPFASALFAQVLPQTAKSVVVLDRTKEPGCAGEPLYEDVLAALTRQGRFGGRCGTPGKVESIIGGRFGVAGIEYTPSHVLGSLVHGGFVSGIEAIDRPETKYPHTAAGGEFLVGIKDDVFGLGIPCPKDTDTLALIAPPAEIAPHVTYTQEAVLYGLGSDGTIGACRNAMDIIASLSDSYTQANFEFDGKKSGGLTVSSLRFRLKPKADVVVEERVKSFNGPIRDMYPVLNADFVACHHESYIARFPKMLDAAREGGVFFLNATWPWTNGPDGHKILEDQLGPRYMRQIAAKKLRFIVADAGKVAQDVGLPGRINSITVLFFLRFATDRLIKFEDAVAEMKNNIQKTYGKKSQRVVELNWKAIDATVEMVDMCEVKYDAAKWLTSADVVVPAITAEIEMTKCKPDVYERLFIPANTLQNGDIGIGETTPLISGLYPSGLGRFEKPNTAIKIPTWNASNCIQCNVCSVVCPHQTIRPILVSETDLETYKDIPEGFETVPLRGPSPKIPLDIPEFISKSIPESGKLGFRIQVSGMDCKGCGLCVEECLANVVARKTNNPDKFALQLSPNTSEVSEIVARQWNFSQDVLPPIGHAIYSSTENRSDLRSVQFTHPYFEFNGACPGCQETQYLKMITQGPNESGSRLVVSVGVGCCLVWSNFGYLRPYYSVSDDDMRARSSWLGDDPKYGTSRGPAVATSLFEDNAEFGWGIAIGSEARRDNLKAAVMCGLDDGTFTGDLKDKLQQWVSNAYTDHVVSRALQSEIRALLPPAPGAADPSSVLRYLSENTQLLPTRTYWIIGGDGWAYDIGSAGLDHVLHSRTKVNILVMDNNLYANTGGQCSKGTPIGAVTKHAFNGVRLPQKRLAEMMVSAYHHTYIAQVSIGADRMHAYRSFREAENHDGPALIVAYCPCIAHNITAKNGLAGGVGMEEQRFAVETGLWPIFTRDPSKDGGKVKLISPAPKRDINELVRRELRWAGLADRDLETANRLVGELRKDIHGHMNSLRHLAGMDPLPIPEAVEPAFAPKTVE